MALESGSTIRFGCFLIDCERKVLTKDLRRLRLTAKPFEVLVYLVQNRDRIISKEELLEQVWGASGVTPGSVEQAVRQIREALGDKLKEPSYIQTVWGEGYRFVARAEAANSEASDDAAMEGRQDRSADQPTVPSATSEPTAAINAAAELQPPEDLRRTTGFYEVLIAALYAALYTIAVLTETAYEFERFRNATVLLAPLVFAWSLTTTLVALRWNVSVRGNHLFQERIW